jgi:hypothetical protein
VSPFVLSFVQKGRKMFNTICTGAPNAVATGYVNDALDIAGGVAYFASPFTIGWQPITSGVAKSNAVAQVANNANLMTYAVVNTGLYKVNLYAVSTNTPTAATIPEFTVVYTDAATGATVTQTLAAVASVNAAGVVSQGSFTVLAKQGTNVVVATPSGYVAGSGTALAYNAYANVAYVG